MELVHMTAQYSNAVLLAVMPHISDFAVKMKLPIPQPITASQVAKSSPSLYAGYVAAGVWLTNGYWFVFHWHGDGHHGLVDSFSAPTNWFREQEFSPERIQRYIGVDNMSTNAALALARETLVKLGFKPELTHADQPPTEIEGPVNIPKTGQHIPYCRITWEWSTSEFMADVNHIAVAINLDSKTVVGLAQVYGRTNSPPTVEVKLGVEPVLEKDFRRSQEAAGKK
jgi:hypothetical protein